MVQSAAVSAGIPAPVAVALDEVECLSEPARLAFERGEVDEAIWILEDVALRYPDSTATQRRLGVALFRRRRYLDARAAYRRALELDSGLVDAHHGLGLVLCKMKEMQQGLDHLRRAAELDPQNASVQNDLGGSLMALNRLDEAQVALARAAELRPDWAPPLHNEALLYLRLGERDLAMEVMRRAAAAGTPLPLLQLDLALQLLAQGEFREGWREYEWRWPSGGKPLHREDLVVPLWDGSPLGERTLLLWTEQGHGDALQFVRFASLIPKERGRLILYAPARLAAVLATCDGIDRVIVDGDTVEVDLQFPLLSLPNILGVDAPAPVGPYLSAPAECPDADEAVQRGSAFNVGIVWGSGKLYPNHAARDCPLALFERLAAVPGVRLFSLQYGERVPDLAESPAPIVDLSPVLGDFYKTAAFVKRMDLVISVDTSLPHLAGALGVPVWLLVPTSPDWRWMREGEESLWYATMRLFRQETAGDWTPVMERIERELRALTAGRYTAPPLPMRVLKPKTPVKSTRVFIKQYGERQTGTNFLRTSLLASFEDIEVLMHLLGDKNSPPPPLRELRAEASAEEQPAWSFVSKATFGAPAALTQPWRRDQLEEVARVAVALTEAFDRGELRYLVSVKDPYAWVVSVARQGNYIVGQMALPDTFATALATECRRFNRLYSAWLALVDEQPERACVVRYEDLLRDPRTVVAEIGKRFGLQHCAPQWQVPAGKVLPALWDGWGTTTSETVFDRQYYLARRYLERIPVRHRHIIAETIDWSLCARMGYAPLPD